MDDLVLYIFRQDKPSYHHYTFVLEERDRLPVIGQRRVYRDGLLEVNEIFTNISRAVNKFLEQLAVIGKFRARAMVEKVSSDEYRSTVSNEIRTLGDLLRSNFWPNQDREGKDFCSRFAELENSAKSSGIHPHLLIASNDSKIPWWVTLEETAEKSERALLICELFALGCISLRNNQPEPKSATVPVELRVITCPTVDLARSRDLPEIDLEPIAHELQGIASYKLLSGRRNPENMGLSANEIQQGFSEGKIILYHGHFNLDRERIEDSTILACGPDASRHVQTPIPITSLELENKYLIFMACETAGMAPEIDETLAEHVAKQGSTLIGTLYPIFDSDANILANELSANLFRNHLSWGESLRRARTLNGEKSLFYRAAPCHFGVPWQMSPLFGIRKKLRVLIPAYLQEVYKLVEPEAVYSCLVELDFLSPQDLDRNQFTMLGDDGNTILLAALPASFSAKLIEKEPGQWMILGPLVASSDDVWLVSNDGEFNFLCEKNWQGKTVAFKGRNLTASAFTQVLLNKWGISLQASQWKTIPSDCAAVIREGLADIALVVAREDLEENEPLPGASRFAVDTELASHYGGASLPRILWLTKSATMSAENRYYIIEFLKRLGEQIKDIKQPHRRRIHGTESDSKIWLARADTPSSSDEIRAALLLFMQDWKRVVPGGAGLSECDFYDWSRK